MDKDDSRYIEIDMVNENECNNDGNDSGKENNLTSVKQVKAKKEQFQKIETFMKGKNFVFNC